MSLSATADRFTSEDIDLLACVISAPDREAAAEWLGCSPTHLRRRLRDLRDRFAVDTNEQLIVLASISGSIDPRKVLPFDTDVPVSPGGGSREAPAAGEGAMPDTPAD